MILFDKMTLRTKKIYLAGTIYKNFSASKWKETFANSINNIKTQNNRIFFNCIDPNPNENNNIECHKSIVPVDKQLIKESDILVAYIEKITFGTTMEIFYAFEVLDKLVIVIDINSKFQNDIWLKYHTHLIVKSIDSAISYIHEVYDNVIYM